MDQAKEETLANLGKLVLRVTAGGLMITHGWGKMMKFFAAGPIKFADPLGIGVTASLAGAVLGEVVCPALLVAGAGTRFAAVPAAFTMAVAAFIVHGGDPLRKKEMALIYMLMYVAVGCLGAGDWSVDGWLKRRKG